VVFIVHDSITSTNGTASLTIVFLNKAKSSFTHDEKRLIKDMIQRAEKQVRALLPVDVFRWPVSFAQPETCLAGTDKGLQNF
jgi:hypothetical protein